MIITENKTEVLTNLNDTSNFSIEMSGKAFSILSSNLYSKPVLAVVRELLCNAYDSHIEANQTKQIDITLPTSFDQNFIIKDYGTGLSDEDIKDVYTTFFKSTKTHSNKFIGCLGLGSKTPFAVSDSFTIESRYNGTKTIYSAYLNDVQCPVISTVLSVKTNEINGLTVKVPVKRSYIYDFKESLKKVLLGFDNSDFIKVLNIDFDPYTAEKEYLSSNVYYFKNNPYYMGNNLYVIQGNVMYSVGMDYLTNENKDFLSNFDKKLIFTVPIGTVNVQASREELHFDKDGNTEKIINDAVKKMQFDFLYKIEKDCDCDNIGDTINALLEYKPLFLKTTFKKFVQKNIPQLASNIDKIFQFSYIKIEDVEHKRFTKDSYYNQDLSPADRRFKYTDLLKYVKHGKTNREIWLFTSIKRAYKKKALFYTEKEKINFSVVNIIYSATKSMKQIETEMSNDFNIDFKFLADIGNLVYKTPNTKTSTVNKNTGVLVYGDNFNITRPSHCWDYLTEDEIEDLEIDKTFYVELDRNTFYVSGMCGNDFNFKAIRAAGYNIIGIRKKAKKYKKKFNLLTKDRIRGLIDFKNINKHTMANNKNSLNTYNVASNLRPLRHLAEKRFDMLCGGTELERLKPFFYRTKITDKDNNHKNTIDLINLYNNLSSVDRITLKDYANIFEKQLLMFDKKYRWVKFFNIHWDDEEILEVRELFELMLEKQRNN